MRNTLGLALVLSVLTATSYGCKGRGSDAAAPDPSPAIRAVMDMQVEAWNHGDIEGFLEGYWHSPDLIFASRGRFSRGWEQLLERYRESYPQGQMGKLRFDDIEIHPIDSTAAWAVGSWWLQQENGAAHGAFTLLWRKTDAGWRIIHDHSSGVPDEPAR